MLNEPTPVDVEEADAEATKDPGGETVLLELQELERADTLASVPAIRGSEGLTVPEWLHTVDGDVASYWQRQFNLADYRYQAPQEVIYDKPVRTRGCGTARNAFGPFFCSVDDTIYLPVRFFTTYSNRFGDAAIAVIVAHEQGHAVQDLLGLFDRGLLTAQTELQADCLAGVWAKTVDKRGLLEEGDIGEILGLVENSGDAEGTPIDAPGAHGNSALRQDFFDQGYEGGSPGDCPVPKRRQIQI